MDIHKELATLSAKDAAARLIGCELHRQDNLTLRAGIIVETEAYDQTDIASHSYRGITLRNSVMFGPAGIAYVYFTYGLHFCMNVVVGAEDHGAAVLIRAIEPFVGLDKMAELRKTNIPTSLCSGPAKLTQALSIDRKLNGHDLSLEPLRLIMKPRLASSEIAWGKRIGIKEESGTELIWRAIRKESKYISRRI